MADGRYPSDTSSVSSHNIGAGLSSLAVRFGTDIEEEFNQKLQSLTRKSHFYDPPREFVLSDSLLAWLRESDQEGGRTHVGQLLNAAYGQERPPSLVQDLKAIMAATDNNCWLKVFVILQQLGRGNYIDDFFSRGIVDKRLPLKLGDLKAFISTLPNLNPGEKSELAERFYHLQWRLCVGDTLNYIKGGTPRITQSQILPFCDQQPVKPPPESGPPAKIFQVQIPYECLSETTLKDIRYRTDTCKKECHDFALKVLDKEKDYKQESFAYRALSGRSPGIVQCLGWWEVEVAESNPKYHLLLEYGWYDMDEYMENYPPPTLPQAIIKFWRHLLIVIKAVDTVHNFKDVAEDSQDQYYGCHGDIKPENILWCQDGWKVADPGFARLLKAGDKRLKFDKHRNPLFTLRGGTTTYGPPEMAPGTEPGPVTQRVDIWSLGCVLSEAATWVILGYRGVAQYRLVRRMLREDNLSGPGRDDSFHDGSQMSLAVKDWHNYLRETVRTCDPVTLGILDLIESKALLPTGASRVSAKDLHNKMFKMLKKAEAHIKSEYGYPRYIADAIRMEQQETTEKWMSPEMQAASRRTNRYKSTQFTSIIPFPGPAVDPVAQLDSTVPDSRRNNSVHAPPLPFGPQHVFDPSGIDLGIQVPVDKSGTRRDSEKGKGPENFGFWEARHHLEHVKGWVYRGTLELPDESAAVGPRHINTSASQSDSIVPQSPPASLQKSSTFSGVKKFIKRPRWSSRDLTDIPRSDQSLSQPVGPASNLTSNKYKDPEYALLERDIIFLVDNSPSMVPHWERLRELVAVLVALLHLQDADGMDLYFTSSKYLCGTYSLPKEFTEQLDHHRPRELNRESEEERAGGPSPVPFDGIMPPLRRIISKAEEKGQKFTLIILTDGQWQDIIGNRRILLNFLSNRLDEWEQKPHLKEMMKHRDISIQFIQFGSDKDVTKLFAEIDDDLKTPQGKRLNDIIDGEPADGNVKKMLLGSVRPDWDEVNTGTQADDMASATGESTGNRDRAMSQTIVTSPTMLPDEFDPGRDTAQTGGQFISPPTRRETVPLSPIQADQAGRRKNKGRSNTQDTYRGSGYMD